MTGGQVWTLSQKMSMAIFGSLNRGDTAKGAEYRVGYTPIGVALRLASLKRINSSERKHDLQIDAPVG